jgi:hypothetical protein
MKFGAYNVLPTVVPKKPRISPILASKIKKNVEFRKKKLKLPYKIVKNQKATYYHPKFTLKFNDLNIFKKYHKPYMSFYKKQKLYKSVVKQLKITKPLLNKIVPGLVNNLNRYLFKNIKRQKHLPFKTYKYLFFKRKHTRSKNTKQSIDEIYYNYSYNPVEKMTMKNILTDDTKNTHQQGIIKYNELVKPILYDINPSIAIKKL